LCFRKTRVTVKGGTNEGSQAGMPTIMVEGPPITVEQKRELVKRLTGVAVEVYRNEHVTVLIKENPPENVGVGGQLLADRRRSG
jgi:4-oxalocrotonate tautomerase